MKRVVAGLSTLLLAVGVLVAGGAPAQAEQRVFHDKAKDTKRVVDIRRVTVDYAKRLTVTAKHRGPELNANTTVFFYVDSRRRNAGPEYRAFAIPNSDGFGLARVDGWKDSSPRWVNCRGLRMRADMFDETRRLVMSVPGRCIKDPKKVRVAVRAKAAYTHKTFNEWAPGVRRFFGRVDRF